jgi:hypothetical protein
VDVVAAHNADPKRGAAAASCERTFDYCQHATVESPVPGYDPVRDPIAKEISTKAATDPNADPRPPVETGVARANPDPQGGRPSALRHESRARRANRVR